MDEIAGEESPTWIPADAGKAAFYTQDRDMASAALWASALTVPQVDPGLVATGALVPLLAVRRSLEDAIVYDLPDSSGIRGSGSSSLCLLPSALTLPAWFLLSPLVSGALQNWCPRAHRRPVPIGFALVGLLDAMVRMLESSSSPGDSAQYVPVFVLLSVPCSEVLFTVLLARLALGQRPARLLPVALEIASLAAVLVLVRSCLEDEEGIEQGSEQAAGGKYALAGLPRLFVGLLGSLCAAARLVLGFWLVLSAAPAREERPDTEEILYLARGALVSGLSSSLAAALFTLGTALLATGGRGATPTNGVAHATGFPVAPSLEATLAALTLAVVAPIAVLAELVALRRLPAPRLATLEALCNPLVAILAAALASEQALSLRQAIASIAVFVGIVLACGGLPDMFRWRKASSLANGSDSRYKLL
eukprot:TRINITY_DN58073_c0_g1_i1.p1 TRINITY_DN58073_c0_g1~~TRINITY_DN58073_c0_g1_i1.p1  ORF type:complete len:450 (+),score=74.32 TRINITY_DN58073_c0_g1_i1:90-1352(+)